MKTWVFFCPAIGVPWWSRLCDRQFTHCFMITEQEAYGVKLYIRLEGLTRILLNDVTFVPIESTIAYIRGKFNPVRILTGDFDVEQPDGFNQMVHLNCVSIIKKRLGINKPWVITPKQLYRHLKATGYRGI